MGSQPRNKKPLPGRGFAIDQFPGKLHDLITFAEQNELDDVIAWSPNGRVVMVHDPEQLLKILPRFGISQTKYRSFERQLNMWHWERAIQEQYKGGWTHPYFIRGNKSLCNSMSRHFSPTQHESPLVKSVAGVPPSQYQENKNITPISISSFDRSTRYHESLDFPLRGFKDIFVPPPQQLSMSHRHHQQPGSSSSSSSMKQQSLGSLKDYQHSATSAWHQKLFDVFTDDEQEDYEVVEAVKKEPHQHETTTTPMIMNSPSTWFDVQAFDALYEECNILAPTPIAEFSIEPTPLKEDRLLPARMQTSTTAARYSSSSSSSSSSMMMMEPLSKETMRFFFKNSSSCS